MNKFIGKQTKKAPKRVVKKKPVEEEVIKKGSKNLLLVRNAVGCINSEQKNAVFVGVNYNEHIRNSKSMLY